ncbi:hypothetical protein [Aureivirga marina]|uniref:hypothetical protein n=1 Tax=Aureivirga marina TaxID=1182451 RepID=UPI0018CA871B|nr:hypothetical protein [Aureivirga marina]
MRLNILLVAVLIPLFYNCSSDKKETEQKEEILQNDSTLTSQRKVEEIAPLTNEAKKNIEEWKYYNQLNELVERLKTMSVAEAFSNADELTFLTRSLKDSISVDDLDIPEIRIRLNLLNNEALKLKDLSTIQGISLDSQANNEIQKIVETFSGINNRINSVYYLKDLQSNPQMNAMDSLFLKDLKSLKDTTEVIKKQKKTNDTSKTKKPSKIKPKISSRLLKKE